MPAPSSASANPASSSSIFFSLQGFFFGGKASSSPIKVGRLRSRTNNEEIQVFPASSSIPLLCVVFPAPAPYRFYSSLQVVRSIIVAAPPHSSANNVSQALPFIRGGEGPPLTKLHSGWASSRQSIISTDFSSRQIFLKKVVVSYSSQPPLLFSSRLPTDLPVSFSTKSTAKTPCKSY